MSSTEVSEAIDTLLNQFITQPFLNLREHDYQAELFTLLRNRFPLPIPVQFVMNPAESPPHSWMDPQTSRVHREPAIGSKRPGKKWIEPDVVLLHNGPVTLTCHAHGPLATQKHVEIEHIDVAVELKNTPSKNTSEVRNFLKDVAKLRRLQALRPSISCFAVFLDQSVSIPSACSSEGLTADWISRLPGMVHIERPARPYVEVCFIDPDAHVPRRRFVADI